MIMTHKIENQLEEIQSFITQQTLAKKDILTLAEAAAYSGLSKSFLYKKTSLRQITFYKLEGKLIYFKKSELEAYLLANRLAPISEVVDSNLSNLKNKRK